MIGQLPPPRELLLQRQKLMGPAYSLFYDEPLHVVRGEGVWLYDRAGGAFLDAYNNVPVVGHSHPRVTEAIAEQMATLNTHTRYLHEKPIELADRLLATMPTHLAHVMFTCSGSEANDLAGRIAKCTTGGTGFIVTANAYHGTTDLTCQMSPSVHAPGAHVYTVPPPLTARDVPAFTQAVRQALDAMAAARIGIAALLLDTILSSDGIVGEYGSGIDEAVRLVHSAGGLYIADEVQPGFGRLGQTMWGFERYTAQPDLVTLGKPMGNGYPVAALVARADILERFSRSNKYFNTFGGNTVACAAGLAVLEIIEEQRLVEQSRELGSRLFAGLSKLQNLSCAIRSVRGAGLFAGVELLSEPSSRAGGSADIVANQLRRRGILVGVTGPKRDVLKIRPPLVIQAAEIDYFLDNLSIVLSHTGSARGE